MDFQFMRLAFQTLLLCRHYISVSYNIHEFNIGKKVDAASFLN